MRERADNTAALLFAAFGSAVGCGPGQSDLPTSQDCGGAEPIRIADVTAAANGVLMLGDAFSVWHHVDGERIYDDTYLVDPCGAVPARRYAQTAAMPAGSGWISCGDTSIQWTTALDVPATSLDVVAKYCEHVVNEHGLFVVDDDTRSLLWFADPASSAKVLAKGVYHPSLTHLGSDVPHAFAYAVTGDQVWYISDDGDLHQLDLQTRNGQVVAHTITSVVASPWKDLVAWSRPRHEGEAYGRTFVRRLDTGETVELRGYLSDLDFEGFVVTRDDGMAGIYDLQRRRRREFGPGDPFVVRTDGHGAFILVRLGGPPGSDGSDAVVYLDLDTGIAATVAQEVGWQSLARVDPMSNGILVYSDADPDVRNEGTIRRFSSAGTEVLAENISPLFVVGRDGSLLYEDVQATVTGPIYRRDPDGRDQVFVESGWLMETPVGPYSSIPGHLPPVDLHGDILYSVASGPDTGLWRMPFQR